jgi:protein TonB
MNERARAMWRRHAALLVAAIFHIGLLLLLPSMNPPAPPADPVEVAMTPPVPLPKPKPIHSPPAVRPAETNSSAQRADFRPAPRLPRVLPPAHALTLPEPLAPRPPMALPAGSPGPATTGAPAGGSGGTGGGNGTGAGNAGQEGNDYLIRLKAYIDAHKGRARHVEPNDADLVLVLDPDGMLTDIRIAASSGDPSVDDEIMNQLKAMSPFPKPPPVLFSGSRKLLSVADRWIFPRP